MVEQGRREGRSDAGAALAAERSRTHRQARALVLAAQRAAYDDLRAAVRQQATTLPDDPAWPATARPPRRATHAGCSAPTPSCVEVPGGVRARSGSRTVELTVSSLAEAELVALGPGGGEAVGAVTGHVVRVNGPLVDVEGLEGAAMSELVELGPLRLLGEVVALDGGRARTQAYEYTGGLAPGAPVRRLGHPLSAELGPGLLGGVYDGLLRPLATAGTWLEPGATTARLRTRPTRARRPGPARPGPTWDWTPAVTTGADLDEGALLGTVDGAGPLAHRVLVPPGVSGTVAAAACRRARVRHRPGGTGRWRGRPPGLALAGAAGPAGQRAAGRARPRC